MFIETLMIPFLLLVCGDTLNTMFILCRLLMETRLIPCLSYVGCLWRHMYNAMLIACSLVV